MDWWEKILTLFFSDKTPDTLIDKEKQFIIFQEERLNNNIICKQRKLKDKWVTSEENDRTSRMPYPAKVFTCIKMFKNRWQRRIIQETLSKILELIWIKYRWVQIKNSKQRKDEKDRNKRWIMSFAIWTDSFSYYLLCS